MRQLILKMSMSVDGYVKSADGDDGWITRTASPEGRVWVEQTVSEAGAHLIGRRTYEFWRSFWPTMPGPIAAAMNDIPKVVFTRSGTLDLAAGGEPHPGWDDPRVMGADLEADIAALKAEPGKDLLAQGGVAFCRSLVQHRLVDEYRLVVHPVVLGAGEALFAGTPPLDLELVDATRMPSGVQALVYRPR